MPKIITLTLGYNKLNCACVLLSDLSWKCNTVWREQKEKPPRKHDQNLHTEGDYIINYTWFITVIYRGIEQFGRPQRSKLDLSWTDWEPMNRGFPHIWSCILTCYACFKNMNFGGSSDLFKKLGPKFEDEGLFYSF